MITFTLNRAATEIIAESELVTDPRGVDGQAFLDHWNRRTQRTFGRGYRTSLTAPVWVFNWLMDTLAPVLSDRTSHTRAEWAGAQELCSYLSDSGLRNHEDGPTANELMASGHLPQA